MTIIEYDDNDAFVPDDWGDDDYNTWEDQQIWNELPMEWRDD